MVTRKLLSICASALLALSLTSPAGAACDPALSVPPSVLITPASSLLFYGDSITSAATRSDHHYSLIFQELMRATYCDFAGFTVAARGRRGSNYARYQGRAPRFVEREADDGIFFDFIFLQDAGRALKTESTRRPDSKRLFGNAIPNTLDGLEEVAPGINVYVATTPGLDVGNARRGFVRVYDRQNDWLDLNVILEDIAADRGINVTPWAEDSCEAYAAFPGSPWTADGIHPKALGDLVLALSLVKVLGVPEADLNFESLSGLNAGLDPVSASALAAISYSPPGLCP